MMDIERFDSLAQAYGGDLRRWPEVERQAAESLRARSPEATSRVLAAAGDLDFALAQWVAPAPSVALRERITALAPRPRRAKRGLGVWLSGAGFAAAAVAGLVVGLAASDAAVSDLRADEVLSATLPTEIEPGLAPFTIGQVQVRGA